MAAGDLVNAWVWTNNDQIDIHNAYAMLYSVPYYKILTPQ